jgi:two-component system CheB/CheR fusion protein
MDDSRFRRSRDSEGPAFVRPLRILLVEDHEETLGFLSHHLSLEGHSVTTARSAAEAIAIVRERVPEVLLCDISLPDADGCELLGKIADRRPPLCIAMSGYGASSDLRRSESAGFHHHLTKPFLPDDLDHLLGQS